MEDASAHETSKSAGDTKVFPVQNPHSGLRRVPGKFPKVALLILIVEVRFLPSLKPLDTEHEPVRRTIHVFRSQRAIAKLHQVSLSRSRGVSG